MKLSGNVGQPLCVHVKRPIRGLTCTTEEPSGVRFWNLIKNIAGDLETFNQKCFVHNFCPLALFDSLGHNITPSELKVSVTSFSFEYSSYAIGCLLFSWTRSYGQHTLVFRWLCKLWACFFRALFGWTILLRVVLLGFLLLGSLLLLFQILEVTRLDLLEMDVLKWNFTNN